MEIRSFEGETKRLLAEKTLVITFTKKNGEERVMLCTTNPALIPQDQNEINEEKARKKNDEVQPVWDLEAKAWRSFRWDSVKFVTIHTV